MADLFIYIYIFICTLHRDLRRESVDDMLLVSCLFTALNCHSSGLRVIG